MPQQKSYAVHFYAFEPKFGPGHPSLYPPPVVAAATANI